MTFFEKVGKCITDAVSVVVNVAKNVVNAVKLGVTNAGKETKIQSLYAKIGKAYYENHKDDALAEEKELVDEVNALSNEISQNKEKIKNTKDKAKYVKCVQCGASVPEMANFCSICGAKKEN